VAAGVRMIVPAQGKPQRYCSKCGKTMVEDKFYLMPNGERSDLCKACETMHINNFEPDTYLWLLKKYNVPYIESEWNILRDRAYQKDPYKMNGMSVFGKYISKMKLKQFKDYTWADTEMLAEKARKEAEMYGTPTEQMQQKIDDIKQAYENGEITEAQYLTYAEINAPKSTAEVTSEEAYKAGGGQPKNVPFEQIELEDVGAQLTDEDKMNLAIKWGTLYRANEWVALEKLYNDFMNSFDIQGAARIDTLKKICKTSLKMDQAIDCGDVESYQKLSRVYDALMKSAKFTEAQNKEDKGDFVDSLGQMVDYCEKIGGIIPRHEIKVPYDIIDKIIDDLKAYNKSLIYEDKSLAEEIEQYLKNKQSADEMKRDRQKAREQGLDYVELEDEDYAAFQEAIAADIEKDKELYEAGGEDV
jgi:hypothetical protein